MNSVEGQWRDVDRVVAQNTERVVQAFRHSGLSSQDLLGTTGYGYDDRGRAILDDIFAKVFGTEAAIVRAQWASGTHAIATALKAITKSGTRLLVVTGTPYDTIHPTLRYLDNRGVKVEIQSLDAQHLPKSEETTLGLNDVVYIQRSRGYSERSSWGPQEIVPVVKWAHRLGAVVMVDNCYGEFTRPEEPGHWGADLVVGSLMKNPGGTIAPTGAYAAGQRILIDRVTDELFAPGIGGEVGATAPYLRLIAQGLFLAPQMVGEALMGGIYLSHAASSLRIVVNPGPMVQERNDIVVALDLDSAARVIEFCQVIQSWSPIDALARPEPWDMPGYEHPIIMAAGGFVAGGSLELSADAPIRPPYRIYVQGGANRWHTKLAIDAALARFMD